MLIPRIGLITVSLPPELSTVPAKAVKIADELSAEVEKTLKEVGLNVLRHPKQIRTVEDSLTIARRLEEDVDCIIYLLGSWIYVPIIVAPAHQIRIPIILWGIPHLTLGSSVASFITHGSLDEVGVTHKFVYGHPNEESVIKDIVAFSRAAMAIKRMRGQRLGLIGGRCMYMYTTIPDLIQLNTIFGVETVHIDEYRLILEAEKISDEEAKKFYENSIKTSYGKIYPPEDVMLKSIKLYFALKKLIKEEALDFVAIKCIPEVAKNYTTCCLAVSLTNDEGTVVACECDVNAALTMQILHLLSNQPVGFADVFHVDKQNNVLRLINCGTLATGLAKSRKDVDLGLQYEFIGEGRGATSIFCCKPGEVTLARLGRIRNRYVMEIATGEAFEQSKDKFKEDRDVWPHMFIKLKGDINKFIQNCRSNHIHFTYGDYREELMTICDLLGITPILI